MVSILVEKRRNIAHKVILLNVPFHLDGIPFVTVWSWRAIKPARDTVVGERGQGERETERE